MKRYFAYLLSFFLAAIFAGCAKDNMETNTGVNALKIAEGYATGAGVKVELYATEALTTGYNAVAVALFDSVSRQPVQEAQVMLESLMDMGTMMHSSPVEYPDARVVNDQFQGAVVFTMPSGAMGSWTLKVTVIVNGRQGAATFPVTIVAPRQSRLKSFVSKVDNKKYWVALLQPRAPKVGVNDMEIAIYEAKSMMAYPADSSLSVVLTPEMPTMGHGSPNNVDPVHIGKGHYKGKVNFTMTGLWYLNLDFRAGSAVADTSTYFEVTF